MTTVEIVLLDAAAEIKMLRRQNEILSAKMEVMDLFACVLHTQPAYRPQTASPCVVQAIERELAKLKKD
jgi:hypothetical protein